jgi:hypothetical protein
LDEVALLLVAQSQIEKAVVVIDHVLQRGKAAIVVALSALSPAATQTL